MMRPPAPHVVGEDLRMAFHGRVVLDVPRIELTAGRTFALLGASGAGKSTLLRLLGLLEKPQSGRVLFDGVEMHAADLAARRRIAAVFQKPYLLRGTVADNVGYGLKLRGIAPSQRRQAVAEALALVGLGGWENRSAPTLSGGEAQRVALARALVLRPALMLLDEPLSYLDPLLKRSLSREFAEILSEEHITALYVTHDQDEAAVVADVMAVMRDGRIVAQGSADDVLGLPVDEWVASFVGMQPPLAGTVASSSGGLSVIEVGGASVITSQQLTPGRHVIAAVRPEDVALYAGDVDLPAGSARNHFRSEIVEVRPHGGTMLVVLRVGTSSTIAATVSRVSAAELSLAEGRVVTAVFKATAVRAREVG